MGTKGNPFPELTDENGNSIVTDGKSLLLVGDGRKNLIGLSNETGSGLAISGTSQWHLGNFFYFIGKGNPSTIFVDEINAKKYSSMVKKLYLVKMAVVMVVEQVDIRQKSQVILINLHGICGAIY